MTNDDDRSDRSTGLGDEQVRALLERLGTAISDGDAAAAASCFEVPALMLMSNGTRAFSSRGELADLFEQAVRAYRGQGLVATKPDLKQTDRLGDDLIAVDVRWPAFDKEGVERMSEVSHYILQLDESGTPRIRVALTRTTNIARA